jgi:hypothetical protein
LRTNLLREIVTSLRRARSLLTLDVSGNPGISIEIREHLSKKVRCKENPYDLEKLHYVNAFVNDLMKAYELDQPKNEKMVSTL